MEQHLAVACFSPLASGLDNSPVPLGRLEALGFNAAMHKRPCACNLMETYAEKCRLLLNMFPFDNVVYWLLYSFSGFESLSR